MRPLLLIVALGCATTALFSQRKYVPVSSFAADTASINRLNEMAYAHVAFSFTEAADYARQAIEAAREINYTEGLAMGHRNLGIAFNRLGLQHLAIEQYLQAQQLCEQTGNHYLLATLFYNMGSLYYALQDYDQALAYSRRALQLNTALEDESGITKNFMGHGLYFRSLLQFDSAEYYTRMAVDRIERNPALESELTSALSDLAALYAERGWIAQSKGIYNRAAGLAKKFDNRLQLILIHIDLGKLAIVEKEFYTATSYFYEALRGSHALNHRQSELAALAVMVDAYEKWHKPDSALSYAKKLLESERTFFNVGKAAQVDALQIQFEMQQKEKELLLNQEELRFQRLLITVIGAALILALMVGIVIYRSYRQKKQWWSELKIKNHEIQERNEEITRQAEELAEANMEITRMNENLEALVAERTHQIREQSERLIAYAYFNAHKVRGPLARILGLVNVLQLEEWPKTPELNRWLQRVKQSAEELDDMIKEVNTKLDFEEPKTRS